MMPKYAKALLGVYAKKMRDVIHEVQANETDDIVVHKLAEIAADCAWCERSMEITTTITRMETRNERVLQSLHERH